MLRRLLSYIISFFILLGLLFATLDVASFTRAYELRLSLCNRPSWHYMYDPILIRFKKPPSPEEFENAHHLRWIARWDNVLGLRLSHGSLELGINERNMYGGRIKGRMVPQQFSAGEVLKKQFNFGVQRKQIGSVDADPLEDYDFRRSIYRRITIPGWCVCVLLILPSTGRMVRLFK